MTMSYKERRRLLHDVIDDVTAQNRLLVHRAGADNVLGGHLHRDRYGECLHEAARERLADVKEKRPGGARGGGAVERAGRGEGGGSGGHHRHDLLLIQQALVHNSRRAGAALSGRFRYKLKEFK